jgi:AcrR family transcriptional regulator
LSAMICPFLIRLAGGPLRHLPKRPLAPISVTSGTEPARHQVEASQCECVSSDAERLIVMPSARKAGFAVPASADAPAPKIAKARGRPRAFDRTLALDRATRVFWSKGYEATSMADLIEAMGIASTSIYAAFGSKEALFTEALDHYARTSEHLAWDKFEMAGTAREAVRTLLIELASALTGRACDAPTGCMVTLSNVASEGHAVLGELVRAGRARTFERVKERLERAIADGEVPPTIDVDALSRFVQAIQSGISIMARDGASRCDLEAVAKVAMGSWDVQVGNGRGAAAS